MTPQHVAMHNGERINADLLNAHLKAGGHLRILTVYRIAEFRPRNAGCFFDAKDGSTWYGTGLKSGSRYVVINSSGSAMCRLQWASPAKPVQ